MVKYVYFSTAGILTIYFVLLSFLCIFFVSRYDMMFKNNISRTEKIIYATVFAKTLLIFLPPIFVYAKTKELEIQPLHPFFQSSS